jgi:hypothetical protein
MLDSDLLYYWQDSISFLRKALYVVAALPNVAVKGFDGTWKGYLDVNRGLIDATCFPHPDGR